MDEQNKNAANEANEAADLLPIEREGLRKEALLEEFRQVNNKHIRYLLGVVADIYSIKVELSLEALTGDFTGLRIFGATGKPVLSARYVYAEDTYHLIGIDIEDTSIGSSASALSKVLVTDHQLRRTITDTLLSYELAAALYRA